MYDWLRDNFSKSFRTICQFINKILKTNNTNKINFRGV